VSYVKSFFDGNFSNPVSLPIQKLPRVTQWYGNSGRLLCDGSYRKICVTLTNKAFTQSIIKLKMWHYNDSHSVLPTWVGVVIITVVLLCFLAVLCGTLILAGIMGSRG